MNQAGTVSSSVAPPESEVDEISADEDSAADGARDERPTSFGMCAEGVEDDEQRDPVLERRLIGADLVDERDLEPDRCEHDARRRRSAPAAATPAEP